MGSYSCNNVGVRSQCPDKTLLKQALECFGIHDVRICAKKETLHSVELDVMGVGDTDCEGQLRLGAAVCTDTDDTDHYEEYRQPDPEKNGKSDCLELFGLLNQLFGKTAICVSFADCWSGVDACHTVDILVDPEEMAFYISEEDYAEGDGYTSVRLDSDWGDRSAWFDDVPSWNQVFDRRIETYDEDFDVTDEIETYDEDLDVADEDENCINNGYYAPYVENASLSDICSRRGCGRIRRLEVSGDKLREVMDKAKQKGYSELSALLSEKFDPVSSCDFCCDCSMIYDRKLVENKDGHFILVYREDFDVPPEPKSENPVRKIFGL